MVYGHDACIPKKCGQPSGCTQDIFVCTLYSSIPNGEIIKRNSLCYCPFRAERAISLGLITLNDAEVVEILRVTVPLEQREQFLSAELNSMTRKWWKFYVLLSLYRAERAISLG